MVKKINKVNHMVFTATHTSTHTKKNLNRMETTLGIANAFNRDHMASIELEDGHETGIHRSMPFAKKKKNTNIKMQDRVVLPERKLKP